MNGEPAMVIVDIRVTPVSKGNTIERTGRPVQIGEAG
jgi:hypothetical protein